MSQIQVFISSVPSNLKLKQEQQRIDFVLSSKGLMPNIKYVDVASNEEAKKKMKKLTKDPNAVPPHFAHGNEYLGDYKAFHEAVESGKLENFLGISQHVK